MQHNELYVVPYCVAGKLGNLGQAVSYCVEAVGAGDNAAQCYLIETWSVKKAQGFPSLKDQGSMPPEPVEAWLI